jgi:ArsR family transcriptional regulator
MEQQSMQQDAQPEPAALVAFLDSLADPTRLRLLRLLERQELGVAELVEVLQLPQSTVSRHLKTLLDQGWIVARSRGPSNLYQSKNGELPAAARKLWHLVREQSDGWASVRQDRLRLERRLRERPQDAREFFARSAARWDKLRRELYGAAFSDAALRGLLPRSWVVADLACGAGSVAAALAPHVAQVIAVDNSPAMLKAAARRVAGQANVELRRGDLEALPVDDASCDAALLVLALTYVADPEPVLREAARVLRPGGRAVVVDLLRHGRDDFRRHTGQVRDGFEPHALEALLAGAGLAPDHCAPLPPEPEAKGPALLLAAASRPSDSPVAPRSPVARPAARGPERKKR